MTGESQFHKKLKDLQMNLLEMATLAEEALKNAVDALVLRRSDLAAAVIDGDDAINDLEIYIDEQCLNLLALRQPMAIDLRLVTSVMRINADLERVGDLAVNIAENAVDLNERALLPFKVDIEPLGRVALSMLQDSITSFVNKDVELAKNVCGRDDEADDLAKGIVQELLEHMVKDAPAIRRAVSYIVVDRCLERVADLATNISEAAIMYVEGKNIKHHQYEGSQLG